MRKLLFSSTLLNVASFANRSANNGADPFSYVSLMSNGVGYNLQSIMTGTGKASSFTFSNVANRSFAIDGASNGTKNLIKSIRTGTGRAGYFQVKELKRAQINSLFSVIAETSSFS